MKVLPGQIVGNCIFFDNHIADPRMKESPAILPNTTPDEQILRAEPDSQGLIPGDIDEPAVADEEDAYQMFHIRVSSKHLILASRVFKRLLQGSFKEGQQLSSQDHIVLPLPEDNPAALLVLLNLIHGQTRKVPRTVDLWMLTELAILVDKYELLEATEMTMEHWFRGLKSDILLDFTNNLLPLIFVSWVFRKPEIFRKVTRAAQLESEGLLEVNQLPIPQSVLGISLNHVRAIGD